MILNIIEKYKDSGRKYFSLKNLREDLYLIEPDINNNTLKKNLSRFKKDKIIFAAGRGWYSFISHRFQLDTKPIRSIVNLIKREFPLLDFNVWSTEQLLPYFQNIPTRFFVFVYAKKEYLNTIYEYLSEKGKTIYLNPTKKEKEKIYNFKMEILLLRPSITEEPKKKYYSKIEKILVDLYIEKFFLQILDEQEYQIVFENISSQFSLDIPKMLRYKLRRKLFNFCPLLALINKNCQ